MPVSQDVGKQPYIPGEVASLGDGIYYARIRALIEPDNKGKYIAIHVDSGDYIIARSTAEASRILREVHPTDGRVFVRRIGEEPEYELSARILAGQTSKK